MNHTEIMEYIEKLYLNMVYMEQKGIETRNYPETIRKYARVLEMQKSGFERFISLNPASNPAKYLTGEVYKINSILGMVKGL